MIDETIELFNCRIKSITSIYSPIGLERRSSHGIRYVKLLISAVWIFNDKDGSKA